MTNQATFSVDVVGDVTGEKYKALFHCKLRLSHREFLRQDAARREILGPTNNSPPAPLASNLAELISYINAHLVEPIPEVWKKGGLGLEFEDGNIIGAVYDGVVKAVEASQKELSAAAEAAKSDIASVK